MSENDQAPEEAKKPGTEILEVQKREANAEFDRPLLGLSLSALSAGLDLGFSMLLVAAISHLLADSPRPIREICLALSYSVGFLFVILGRSELFTEHTTLDILPVLAGDRSVFNLLRVWVVIYAMNLTGASLFALMASQFGPAMDLYTPETLRELAHGIVTHPAPTILVSGMLAGWLMGLVGWLVAASRETIAQIAVIVIITGSLGLCHLHHCVAGSVEVLSAVFSGQVTWGEYFHFLGWATLGNSLGGAFFVGLIKHGHISYASNS